VTRADLPPGYQAVQAAHAALAFAVRHPGIAASWDREGGSLLFLCARDETALRWLLDDAGQARKPAVPFREPDLGNALTVVAVWDGARLCRKYPIALRSG
jgi:hypothetical protein